MTPNSESEQDSVSETYESAPEGGVASAIKGMFSFFTALPVNIGYKEMKSMDNNFWLVPVIGLFYGLFGTVLMVLFVNLIGSYLLSAAITIFGMHLMNRLLHIDGLIDVGDGLTVAGSREDHLRALKDTTIGAGGMATGMLVTLILIAEYSSVGVWMCALFIIGAEVCARNAQVAAAAFGTASNGMAGNSVRATNQNSLIGSTVLTVIMLLLTYGVTYLLIQDRLIDGGSILLGYALAVLTSVCWGWYMSYVAKRNFGATNGDVLGATNESSRVLCFLAILIVWSVTSI